MIAFGVTKSKARQLFDAHPEEFLRLKIEQLEYLIVSKANKPKNPAGFFVKSIAEDYEAPEGFTSEADKKRIHEKAEAYKRSQKEKRQAKEAEEKSKQEEAERIHQEKKEKIERFLDSLSTQEKEKFIQESYDVYRKSGDPWIDKEGPLGEVTRLAALEDRVSQSLDE